MERSIIINRLWWTNSFIAYFNAVAISSSRVLSRRKVYEFLLLVLWLVHPCIEKRFMPRWRHWRWLRPKSRTLFHNNKLVVKLKILNVFGNNKNGHIRKIDSSLRLTVAHREHNAVTVLVWASDSCYTQCVQCVRACVHKCMRTVCVEKKKMATTK